MRWTRKLVQHITLVAYARLCWEPPVITGCRSTATNAKRPLAVTIIAILYLAVGTIGFVYHGREFLARSAFHYDAVWIELTEFLAILCGVFMLRAQNWARWLALGWIASHVVLSAFHGLPEFAIHVLFCAVIAGILFSPGATRYFRSARVEAT